MTQEALLVFCDIVGSWPDDESFLGYFLSRFPWRLARAIDALERGWSASHLLPIASLDESVLPLDPADPFTVAEIGAGMRPQDRVVLEPHIGYDLRLNEVARVLGVHPNLLAYQRRIVGELRLTLAEPSRPWSPARQTTDQGSVTDH